MLADRIVVSPALAVYSLLRQRAPDVAWDIRRVAFIVEDFPADEGQHRLVAATAADFLAHATRLRDPHGALRRFFERAAAERHQGVPEGLYDRYHQEGGLAA